MSLIRDPVIITAVGHQMMTAGGDITYTKATLYGQDISHLTKEQLESLTSIGNPLLTVPVGISDKSVDGGQTTIALEATFTNANLKADLPYKAVGFFAKKDNGEEKLVILGVANSGAYLAAASPDGVASDALDVKVAIAIGDATNVTAVVDPAGSVTPATLSGAINKATHDLTAKIDTKADKTDVTAQFATKADKTTVEQELAVKANSADVDKELTTKANSDDVYTKTQVNKQIKSVTDLANSKVGADYSYSKAELDKKLLAVTTDASGKVNATLVASMIADKADKTYVDNQIATIDFGKIKFRKQYVNSDGQTADKTWSATKNQDGTYTIDLWQDDWTASKLSGVLAQLPNKADTSTVNAQIADVKNTIKSNVDNLQSAANTKANASDVYTKKQVDDALSSRDATIANKADKSYVDDKVGAIDFSKIKFRKQYVTGNNKTADSTWQATKNADGTYTIDLYNDDWTAQRVVYLLNQIGSKANASDVNSLQNLINQQKQTIQSLTSRHNNAENEINYIKANYVEGRTFPASQEAQANSWENANPQRLAFITK